MLAPYLKYPVYKVEAVPRTSIFHQKSHLLLHDRRPRHSASQSPRRTTVNHVTTRSKRANRPLPTHRRTQPPDLNLLTRKTRNVVQQQRIGTVPPALRAPLETPQTHTPPSETVHHHPTTKGRHTRHPTNVLVLNETHYTLQNVMGELQDHFFKRNHTAPFKTRNQAMKP